MTNKLLRTALVASAMIAIPFAAHAHRSYLVPSETMFDNANNATVTIDASASDELFQPGNALKLDNIVVATPGGVAVQADNAYTGKQRSSFELKLPKEGTYKISLLSDGLSAMYKVNGEMKRWRGTADSYAKEVPANATDINVSRMQSRVETFVTVVKPSTDSLKPTGVGYELVPLTSPTEIYAGDTSTFQFLLDGKPAADQTVTIIPGGNRYRDALNEVTLKTGKDGKFSVKWPDAGLFWLSTSSARPQPGVTGSLAQPIRRVSYSATLEVLRP